MKYHKLGSNQCLVRHLELRRVFPKICCFKTNFKSGDQKVLR